MHSNQIRLFLAILEHCAITEFKMGEITRAIQNDERILRKQWYQNIFCDFSGFPTGSSSPSFPFFSLPFPSFLFFVSVETQDLIQVRGDVIELQVLNGTHWLNLGGNVETFEAVIAVPPETSSQVTLLQALTKLNQVRKCISTREKKSYFSAVYFMLFFFCFADFRSSRQHQSFNTVSTKDSFIFLFAHTATIFKGKKILLHSTQKSTKM